MKYFKTLRVFYYCLLNIPLCVCVTNTNSMKKD